MPHSAHCPLRAARSRRQKNRNAMLPLQPENFRLNGCPGKLYGLVTGVLSLLERISQWTGNLKLIERFECLSPEFSSGEGPARRYDGHAAQY